MRPPVLIRTSFLLLALALALAAPSQAAWSEQGVAVATLAHPKGGYDRATMLHDPGGAYFAYLPYSFGDCLLHLDAAQASAWVKDAAFFPGAPAGEMGNAVALDGSGGLFVFECAEARLHHVAANGTEDWGPGGAGLVVDAGAGAGVALAAERDLPIVFDATSVGALLYLSILGSALSFSLWYWLLSRAAATRVSLISYLNPVVAVGVGVLFLREPITLRILSGSALVVSGVALAAHRRAIPSRAPRGPIRETRERPRWRREGRGG